MRIEVISGPASEPVLLEELKDQLRIDGSDEDAALGAFLSTARSIIEDRLDIALVDRSLDLYLDRWSIENSRASDPWWNGVADGAILALAAAAAFVPLPVRPVSQIVSVTTIADDGSEQVWAAGNYYLKPGLSAGIYRRNGASWPVPGRAADGIRISLTAGFGPNWNAVPAGIRQAQLMAASFLYKNRGDQGAEHVLKASGAAVLLAAYRDRRI